MRRLTLTTLTLVTALALTSCASTAAPHDELDPDAVIIDVRTPAEQATGHLDGALLLDVTSGDLQAALPDLDPKVTYLVYCRSGNRAGTAIDLMKQAGFTDLRNLGSLEDAAITTGVPVVQP
ncbi:Thiosulfate sulfurtransferase PspE [Microbacterium sp. Bi98]|uniref:rhodanese-like domain-containing protein n=1 Tax=Microbacterium sp. Bi98 TaxID=2821116 RepID=UPI001DEA224F|nr:rhodanese-like domain-containing protein [Microbacterium sp. Bi98]CAH0150124.1 Thiosulfate sulfurtransferase PspE [Microbacterium sp. Bi98]